MWEKQLRCFRNESGPRDFSREIPERLTKRLGFAEALPIADV
jgi:hypothetical protein